MKNTHEQLLDCISNLQKMADELGDLNKFKDAAQPELTRDTGKPKFTGEYYWIDSYGKVRLSDAKIRAAFDCYNSFETKAEAEAEAAYTLASRRVRRFAEVVNEGWKPDWQDDKDKYGIKYEDLKLSVAGVYYFNPFIHQITFPTEELAAKALELFRPEWELLSNP